MQREGLDVALPLVQCVVELNVAVVAQTKDVRPVRPTHQPFEVPTITRPLASTVLPRARPKNHLKNGNAAKPLT